MAYIFHLDLLTFYTVSIETADAPAGVKIISKDYVTVYPRKIAQNTKS